jgi:hypothetical protein
MGRRHNRRSRALGVGVLTAMTLVGTAAGIYQWRSLESDATAAASSGDLRGGIEGLLTRVDAMERVELPPKDETAGSASTADVPQRVTESVPATSAASGSSGRRPTRPSAPASAGPPGRSRKPGCYTLGADGVWHVRPDCL